MRHRVARARLCRNRTTGAEGGGGRTERKARARTGVEPIRVWHARVLLEARKRTEIDRPLAQLVDLALCVSTGSGAAGEERRGGSAMRATCFQEHAASDAAEARGRAPGLGRDRSPHQCTA